MFDISRKNVHPIQFCIDESKFLSYTDNKIKPFSSIVPGDNSNRNYTFDTEEEYYKEYNQSYYAMTMKKFGWDCLRHLEIIAAGSIPYFYNLENCPKYIMKSLPKDSILQAMNLPGVFDGSIDMNIFPKKRYQELQKEIYEKTLSNVSGRSIANYVLNIVDSVWPRRIPKILYLSGTTYPDYQRCLLLIGFKRLLGERNVIDIPKIEHIYKSYNQDVGQLYGRGFSYTKILEDDPYINRDENYIKQQISLHEFDFVIFGNLHRGLPFHDFISEYYKEEEIIYICGEDEHDIKNCIQRVPFNSHLFIRELQ